MALGLAAAALLWIAGCSDGITPGSTLTTAMALSPSDVTVGDPVDVILSVTNTGPNGVTVSFNQLQQSGYRVTDLFGTVVAESPEVVNPALSSRLFGPNGTEVYSMTLDTTDLDPGTYRVRAGLLDDGSRYPWDVAFLTVR